MTRVPAFRRMTSGVPSRRGYLLLLLTVLLCAGIALPLVAQGTAAAPEDTSDFGQYVVNHQDTLTPFFTQHAGDFFSHAIPALLSMAGWVIFITALVGWGLDVLMSRAYAFFYAPAFADWKRAIIYATGSLFLFLLYSGMAGLAIVLLVGVAQSQIVIPLAMLLLLLVSIAAQIVWILYLFRTSFGVSILFYLALVIVHLVAAFLITQPAMGSRASPDITNFVDSTITPRLQDEAQTTRQQLAAVTGGRDSSQAKVTESQQEIAQAEVVQESLVKEIEAKKNSDIYALAQIIKARARGDLQAAHDGLAEFPAKFPDSELLSQARVQLNAVNGQLAAAQLEQQQQADDMRAAAEARADLLAHAAKGQATLTEMRQALIGKSRAEVTGLLGAPTGTASDQWNYDKRMIVNPLTNEQSGLTVYFSEGTVQTLDYYRGGD